jgi:hypothetical protein
MTRQPNRPSTAACLILILIGAIAATPTMAAEPNSLSSQELADGWVLLFDGETTFGWRPSSEVDWKIVDGTITATEGEEGLLYTTGQFGNYLMKVDFRSAPGTNSGVFLRTSPKPSDVTTKCYELNIADSGTNDFPTGSFVQRKVATGDNDSGDWQTFEVAAEGGLFLVKLDGETVLDYTDPEPLGRGYIGLQLNSGKIEFRNVKLKPLGTKSMFNGKDLTGWKSPPDNPAVFTVTDEGCLDLKGGSGYLESDGSYDDFTLQLEAIINGDKINSGIFFRSIPGEKMNGYESQIHNAYEDGDRSKPVDCGTGGIFRRQNARKVVANDREWFHITLHADDRHMAAWVNGYQVSDFSDNRKPDKNPRKGLRLEAGTIQIQGHDPTSAFSFRNLRIGELETR